MKKYLLPIVLISSFLGTAVSAQVFRGGGSSGTAYPSGTQYKSNGFCLSNYFFALKSTDAIEHGLEVLVGISELDNKLGALL